MESVSNDFGIREEGSHSEGYGSYLAHHSSPNTIFQSNSPQATSTSLLAESLDEASRVVQPNNILHTQQAGSLDSTPTDPSVVLAPTEPEEVPSSTRSFLTHQELSVLKREDVRLRTYDERFSASFMSPLSLAQAGFFYLGVEDQVQCVFCRGVIGQWEINDNPMSEHERFFPSCPFVLGNNLVVEVNHFSFAVVFGFSSFFL